MHEHRVKGFQHAVRRRPRPGRARRRLEHVADGADQPAPRGPGALDQRFQLEAQQPAAERPSLGDEHVRRVLLERGEQQIPARGPPSVVDLASARVHQGAVAGIRDPGGGKRDDAHPTGPAGREIRDLRPTGHVHDVRLSPGEGQRDGCHAALVADPHQVLDPEHHPGRGGRGGHGRAATRRSLPLSIAFEPDVRLVEGERPGGRVEPEAVRAGPVEAHRGLAGEVPSAGEPQQCLDDPLVGDRDHVR